MINILSLVMSLYCTGRSQCFVEEAQKLFFIINIHNTFQLIYNKFCFYIHYFLKKIVNIVRDMKNNFNFI